MKHQCLTSVESRKDQADDQQSYGVLDERFDERSAVTRAV